MAVSQVEIEHNPVSMPCQLSPVLHHCIVEITSRVAALGSDAVGKVFNRNAD